MFFFLFKSFLQMKKGLFIKVVSSKDTIHGRSSCYPKSHARKVVFPTWSKHMPATFKLKIAWGPGVPRLQQTMWKNYTFTYKSITTTFGKECRNVDQKCNRHAKAILSTFLCLSLETFCKKIIPGLKSCQKPDFQPPV